MVDGRWRVMAALALWLCWLLSSFFSADTLEVETLSNGPLKGIVNNSITFPCKLSGYTANILDLKYVGIRWLRLNNSEESEIYLFNGPKGEHIAKRNGSTMLENEIKGGNASLHLTQIRFNEEGHYKCVVFVGASKAEGLLALEVSAQPEASLTPTDVEGESGMERSISCHMERFYPQLFKIIWKQEDKVISKDICTGYPESNEDGTFTVTSSLRLKLSKEDHQKVVVCIMDHRSFPSPLQLNATLTVHEHEASFAPAVLYIVIAGLLCVLLSLSIGVIYKIFVQPIAPRITEITGNDTLIEKEKANWSCQVTSFRPKEISITVSLKKPQETERCIVYKQCFKQCEKTADADPHDIESKAALLQKPVETFSDVFFCEANIEHSMHRTFSLTLNIGIIPDIQKYNRTELFVTIEHSALTNTISKQRLLNIVGVPPKIFEIFRPPNILHQESLMLGCSINDFKPRPLRVTWAKKDQSKMEEILVVYTIGENTEDETQVLSTKYSHTKNINTFSDGSFSLYSVLLFVPTFEADNGAIFCCRTYHHETDTSDEKKIQLSVKASPVLDPIHSLPDIPNIDDTVTLSCRIHSFFPSNLTVNWHRDGEEMYGVKSTSDVICGSDGLHSCTSSISFSPRRVHDGKTVQCSVDHESLKNHRGEIIPKKTTWKLTNLICCPKRIEIKCDPDEAEQGKTVTLSCMVDDYYPKECQVKWFRGFEPIHTSTLEDPELYKQTELYRRKSQITFTPTAQDHDTEYSVEVTHCNRQLRRTFRMILKDCPQVKEIVLDPVDAAYGQPLTLSCQVMGCDPKDIIVTWFQKEDPILKGVTIKESPDCASRFCQLQIIPTAAHYNQVFLCNVKHRCLPQPIIKRIHLPLKQIPPSVSDITVTPAEPEVGKTVCVKIHVSNFSPKEIQIKWYNGWMDIPKENVTCKDPKIGENNLYVAVSTAEFSTHRDIDTEIRCEVLHIATKRVVERNIVLKLNGSRTTFHKQSERNSPKRATSFPNSGGEQKTQKEVKSSDIECLTSNPKAGDAVRLKCFIPGCCAGDARISWSKGMFPIKDDCVENLNCDDGSGCISTVSLQTHPEDTQCEVRCEVMLNYISTEKKYVLKLH